MIEIYKYGGNVLKDETNRRKIYDSIKEKIKEGIKVLMVVSAFGREKDNFSTDSLGKNIELLSNSDKDQIMTFGEIYSSLIIKNELLRKNINVTSLNYKEIGIKCDNNYQNGNIIAVNMSCIKDLLKEKDVVIVPGFIGESSEGKIISLGRNTSDLTALVLAKEFKIKEVNIVKEVNGVYKSDPRKYETNKKMKCISYDEIENIISAGSKMFAMKTIKYAKENNIIMNIKSLENGDGTIISNKKSDESITFVDVDGDELKVVFKDIDIFKSIYKSIIDNKIKFENIFIDKNIVYLKGNVFRALEIVNSYL